MARRPARISRASLSLVWEEAGMLAVLVLLFGVCAATVPHFLSAANMVSLLLAVSTVGMVSCTMLFCLASGNFDLSVGSVVAFAGVVAAVAMQKCAGYPELVAVALGISAALGAGLLVGLLNGVVVAKAKINPLITTLATMQIVRGLAYIQSGGKTVGVMQERFFELGSGQLLDVPVPVWICGALFVVFGLLLERTTFGRNTLAIGGNEEAARLAGIAVDRTKIVIFALQGVVAAFAGVVLASRMTSGQPTISIGFELEVISACVLGGVSLTGGVGRMRFVIAGVLIMGVVQNAMTLQNVDSFWQYVVRGAILLAAVLFDRFRQMRAA